LREPAYITFECGRRFLSHALVFRQATQSIAAAENHESAMPGLRPRSASSAGSAVGNRRISHSAEFPQRSVALILTLTSSEPIGISHDQ